MIATAEKTLRLASLGGSNAPARSTTRGRRWGGGVSAGTMDTTCRHSARQKPGCSLMAEAPANVTQLLRAAASGERRDLDVLMAALYDDMRRLAIRHLQAERADHTLQPTALVHEAYLRLIDQRCTDWRDRVHFFAIASRVIRCILVDHARARRAAKRGGGGARVDIETVELPAETPGVDLVALDQALTELATIEPTQAQIVEMRYFGGLTIDEISETLSIGKRSVDRHWSAAKAWLCFRLADAVAGAGDE